MDLQFEKQVKDERGKILFYKHDSGFVNIVEINKGFARGGHYHEYAQAHSIISGKVEILQQNINTKKETKTIIDKPTLVEIPAYTAHLFIAHEYTVFTESFSQPYTAINFPEYRKIVEDKLSDRS